VGHAESRESARFGAFIILVFLNKMPGMRSGRIASMRLLVAAIRIPARHLPDSA
jgi:hypothetical protein